MVCLAFVIACICSVRKLHGTEGNVASSPLSPPHPFTNDEPASDDDYLLLPEDCMKRMDPS